MSVTVALVLAVLSVPGTSRLDRMETASLGGRIVDSAGRPLADVIVQLRHHSDGNVAETKTNPEGNYEITGVRAGRYSVIATAQGGECFWKPVILLFEGRRTRLDIVFTGLPWKRGPRSQPPCSLERDGDPSICTTEYAE